MDTAIIGAVTAISKKFLDTMLEAYKERKKIELAINELNLKRDAMRMEYNYRMTQLQQEHQLKIRYLSEAFGIIRMELASFSAQHQVQELFAQQQIQMSIRALSDPQLPSEDKTFFRENYQNYTKIWTDLVKTHDNLLLNFVDDSIRKLNAPLLQLNSTNHKQIR